MEEKIKDIVSVFIKVPADQIGPATAIDRGAVKSSILLHRMYARLQEEGVRVDNYSGIRTFSDLLGRNAALSVGTTLPLETHPAVMQQQGALSMQQAGISVGIDIEEIASFPVTNDFRKEEFYKMNFSPPEIAYCILQADAYASFAGLFTAKEAMVKAGFAARPFNTIDIAHTPEGKPVFPGFQLSISHAGAVAVAVAVAGDAGGGQVSRLSLPSMQAGGQGGGLRLVSWLALMLSVLAIILIFTR